MDISTKFKRGLEHNYIVVTDIDIENDDYQVMMLRHNRIPGLLQFDIKNNNGEKEYYYEVSSMQSLHRIYENNLIDFEGLKKILSGIYFSIKSTANFLLDENDLILSPEHIYMCVEDYKLELMFFPSYNGNINKEFSKFAEFILDRVDHQNNAAVLLAYNIFKVVRMQNFTIEDLIKLIDVSENTHEPNKSEVITKKYEDENIYGNIHESTDDVGIGDEDNHEQIKDLKKEINNTHKKNKGFLKNIFFKSKKQEKNEILEKIMNSDEYDDFIVPDYKEEDSEKEYGKTTLLVPESFREVKKESQKETSLKAKHYLKDIDSGKTYEINEFPATIGKIRGMASVVIESPQISRLHASISYKEGKYYLCDIGSSNGTYLNGFLVEDDIPLEEDDEVMFGNIRMIWK